MKVKLPLRRKDREPRPRRRKPRGARGVIGSVMDIVSLAVFGDIALRIVEKFELDRKAVEGNMRIHPVNLVAKYLYYALLTGVYSVFVWVFLYPVIPYPYNIEGVLATYAIVLFIPFYPLVKVFNAVEENRGKISQEIPFFMFHLAILARTRLSLEDLLNRMSVSTVYPTISSYIRRIKAMSKTLGWDLLHAIEEVGISIPHRALSSTLAGFANALRTKSNVTDFMDRAMTMALEDQRKYLDRLKSSVSTLAMMYAVLMMSILFLNILQITSATGKLALSLSAYAILSVVMIPLLSFMVLWMVYLKIPRLESPGKMPLVTFIAWLPVGAAVGYIVYNVVQGFTVFSSEVGVAIALAVPSFAASRTYARMFHNDEDLIRKFTDFLHDIASERRLGVPLEQIIVNMNYLYGPLNQSLRILKMSIRTGMPMRLAIAMAFSGIRSKMVRFMAILLSDAIVLGTATEETFNFMERMIRELVDVIDSMRSELRSISITPYVIIIVEVVAVVFYININPVNVVKYSLPGQQAPPVGEVPGTLQVVSHYFAYGVIMASFVGAFIIGLLRRQNPWAGFFHAGVILSIIAITFAATNIIGSLITLF